MNEEVRERLTEIRQALDILIDASVIQSRELELGGKLSSRFVETQVAILRGVQKSIRAIDRADTRRPDA